MGSFLKLNDFFAKSYITDILTQQTKILYFDTRIKKKMDKKFIQVTLQATFAQQYLIFLCLTIGYFFYLSIYIGYYIGKFFLFFRDNNIINTSRISRYIKSLKKISFQTTPKQIFRFFCQKIEEKYPKILETFEILLITLNDVFIILKGLKWPIKSKTNSIILKCFAVGCYEILVVFCLFRTHINTINNIQNYIMKWKTILQFIIKEYARTVIFQYMVYVLIFIISNICGILTGILVSTRFSKKEKNDFEIFMFLLFLFLNLMNQEKFEKFIDNLFRVKSPDQLLETLKPRLATSVIEKQPVKIKLTKPKEISYSLGLHPTKIEMEWGEESFFQGNKNKPKFQLFFLFRSLKIKS